MAVDITGTNTDCCRWNTIVFQMSPGEDALWLGFETDVFVNYRFSSDLGLSLNSGVFFPGKAPSGAFTEGTPQYSVNIAMTLGM